jgi:hypothetical protein
MKTAQVTTLTLPSWDARSIIFTLQSAQANISFGTSRPRQASWQRPPDDLLSQVVARSAFAAPMPPF